MNNFFVMIGLCIKPLHEYVIEATKKERFRLKSKT